MRDNQARRSPVCGLNRDEAYLNTLAEQMPETNRVFGILAAGRTPNFLDMMKVLSEIVAFDTDSDQNEELLDFAGENMSQNKCRFCS